MGVADFLGDDLVATAFFGAPDFLPVADEPVLVLVTRPDLVWLRTWDDSTTAGA